MRRILLATVAALGLAGPALAACPDEGEIGMLARGLVSGQAVPQFHALSLADAECARDRLVPLLVPHFGRLIGYKAGATGQAVQQRYGLSGPVWGAMFAATTSLRSGATLRLSPPLAGVGVESDILVRVRDEGINRAGRDHVAILRHLDVVIPYIEMPRGGFQPAPGRSLGGPDLVAGNVNARLGVVGRPIPVQATAEFAARLGTMRVTLTDGEKELANTTGAALLGHPLNVIPWLVEDLAKSGRRLRAGEIVSLGGFAASVPAQAGRTYTQRYEGLTATPAVVTIRVQ